MIRYPAPDLDTRYILYDGYNSRDVKLWLAERCYFMHTHPRSSLLMATSVFDHSRTTYIRPRSVLYIRDDELCTVSVTDLIGSFFEHLSVDQPSPAILLNNRQITIHFSSEVKDIGWST